MARPTTRTAGGATTRTLTCDKVCDCKRAILNGVNQHLHNSKMINYGTIGIGLLLLNVKHKTFAKSLIKPEEIAMHDIKKNFLHSTLKTDFLRSALNDNLLTNEGKEAAHAHQRNSNACAVYKTIVTQCEASTSAKPNSSDLMTCTTAAKINDGCWNGTASLFMHNWKD